MRRLTRHFLLLGIAWFFIALGFVLLFSPVPIGVFFMVIGLSVLITTSDLVAEKVLGYRQKHHKLNDRLNWVEEKLDNRLRFVSLAMHKTRPPEISLEKKSEC